VNFRNNEQIVRFGNFEANLRTGELRKSGIRIRLQEQPFKVLGILLERPGELVSRDDLKQRLWSDSEFGDFDQGLNVAIKKIRGALGDSPETPRFVETLAKRGYRFIAPVTTIGAASTQPTEPRQPERRITGIRISVAVTPIVILAVALGGWWVNRRPQPYPPGIFGPVPQFRLSPLTSSLGYEWNPQFSPDGKQIVYEWSSGKNDPVGIYVKVLGAGNSVRLLPPQEGVAHVLPTWSPDGRFIACVRATEMPSTAQDPKKQVSVAERIIENVEKNRPLPSVYLLP
jgi:DNA-binding winged helix-turn-helix (wHTH) protein